MDIIDFFNTIGVDYLGLTKVSLSVCIEKLIEGLAFTGQIFFVTLLGSLPLGIIIALCRMSKFKPLAWITRAYISFMRGTPLMLQLMALLYGPYYILGIEVDSTWRIMACDIGFILNYAAYFAEIYRGGIQSIPQGHYEAAEVLGYTRAQTFMKIVLPQVVKRIMPAMGNEVITLVKDTSLAYVLTIPEMFSMAKQVSAANANLFPYIIAAAIYWAFTIFVEFLIGRVEKHFAYYHD